MSTENERKNKMHEHYRAAWVAFEETSNLDEALSHLDQAIQLATSPKVESAYLAVYGGFLYRSGLFERAVEACKKAVKAFERNVYGWNHLGLSLFELGSYQEAASCFETSVGIREEFNVYTMLAKAQSYFDPNAARQSAQKALELNPDWDEATAVNDAVLAWQSGSQQDLPK